jgi:sugar O-acyltransferase (sialic acid O-acetyltransferase NeuD family)
MTTKQPILIVGTGEMAEIAYEYFTYDSPYQVVAFTVERPHLKVDRLFDLPVVPFDEVENHYAPAEHGIFAAFLFSELNRVRTRLFQAAKAKGYTPVSYVSSRAFVWRNVAIGQNCFIFENCVLQHHARIGDNVILWSSSGVGHRSVIRDNCFVSSQVVISGYCDVGENCFLGVKSCIADKVKIARDCVLGAGAVVTENTEEGMVYPGNRAASAQVSSHTLFKIRERIMPVPLPDEGLPGSPR